MCILSIFSSHRSQIRDRRSDSNTFPDAFSCRNEADKTLNSLLQEIFDLGSRGLLYYISEDITDRVTRPNYLFDPGMIALGGVGSDLDRLMELGQINKDYLDSVAFKLFPLKRSEFKCI